MFSLTNTATGRLFAAFQSDEAVKRMLDAERALQKAHPEPVIPNVPPPAAVPSWSAFLPQLREVRQHGLSRSEGETLPGVNAMAVPIFDHGGDVAAAITAIGPAGIFDISWNGSIARELRACARRVAHELGAPSAD